jgi:hypothetical protein
MQQMYTSFYSLPGLLLESARAVPRVFEEESAEAHNRPQDKNSTTSPTTVFSVHSHEESK